MSSGTRSEGDIHCPPDSVGDRAVENALISASLSRRNLLRGFVGKNSSEQLLPWALQDFYSTCTRCDNCIRACEESILKRGDGGFPRVDFALGGCTFCAACVDACEEGALLRHHGESAWSLVAVVGANCLSANGVICRACGDVCEHRSILFRLQPGGRALIEINNETCNGCGFCYSLCPERAIELKELI